MWRVSAGCGRPWPGTDPSSPCRVFRGRSGNRSSCAAFVPHYRKERTMRGILLWLLGIPIPVIILLYLFGVLH